MKAVLQRVSQASCVVDSKTTGEIEAGLLILLGVEQGDAEADAKYLAQKSAELRIFADEEGRMNKSVKEINGAILLISQFTLLAEWRKGRRPGFTRAAAPEQAKLLYEQFGRYLEEAGIPVKYGVFGADMKISLINDGPVTLILENQGLQN